MFPPQQSVILPSFDDIMEEIEHLVSIRSSLVISNTNQDNVITIGRIIFEKLLILEQLDDRALSKCDLGELERIVLLHPTLCSDKTQYKSKAWTSTTMSLGELLDLLIIMRLRFFDKWNPFESFTTGLIIVKRLAKVAEAWNEDFMESVLSRTLKRLESISETKIIVCPCV